MRHLIAWLMLVGLGTSFVSAEVVRKSIEYKDGTTTLEATLNYDNASTTKQPAILLAHSEGGAGPVAKDRAAYFSKAGYVVLTADLFGKGIQLKTARETSAKVGPARKAMRDRLAIALKLLGQQPNVDTKKIAGIGYGPAGTVLLDFVRSGAELEASIILHADLKGIAPADSNLGAGPVLAIVGANDPLTPPAMITAFEQEMTSAGVDWQVYRLGDTLGDFTNPNAGSDVKLGVSYDKLSDRRAHDLIRVFLNEILAKPTVAVTSTIPAKTAIAPKTPAGVPEKAMKVLEFVDKNGRAPDGYEGGRNFGNFEKRLPERDGSGSRLRYREWDVNPLRQGVNRGAERLVTGSDGSAYYTSDHYNSFKKIR
jgi:dienelactone hydrolase/guanyl-specific ribonuclease Sa